MIQLLARDYLEECGLKVDIAGSAAEALNKLALIPGGATEATEAHVTHEGRKFDDSTEQI